MNLKLRKIRQCFWNGRGDGTAFFSHSKIYLSIPSSIRIFYGIAIFISMSYHVSFLEQSKINSMMPPSTFSFLKNIPIDVLVLFLNLCPILIALPFFKPGSWLFRFLASISFITAYAYRCSHGVNYHSEMPVAWGTLGLLFVPSFSEGSTAKRIKRHQVVVGYWIFLGSVLFTYFMAGLWKFVVGGIFNLFNDRMSFWNFESMSYVVAGYLGKIGEGSWLSSFILDYPYLGWILIWGGIVTELLVLLPLFKPQLWRPITLALVCLHLFSLWILNIYFSYQILFLLLVLYDNPFSLGWKHALSSIIKSIKSHYWTSKAPASQAGPPPLSTGRGNPL